MWPNPQETADLVTFTEEIFKGKLHFLCSVSLAFWFGTLDLNIISSFHTTGISLYPRKHHKASEFQMYSGGAERDQLHDMG